MDNTVTFVANLVADPELRFTPGGRAVANLRLAHNARRFDPATGGWKDAGVTYVTGTAWQSLAENIAESLHRGDRVIVHGRLEGREWETDAGEKRNTLELVISAIGPDLTFATAEVRKASRAEQRDDVDAGS